MVMGLGSSSGQTLHSFPVASSEPTVLRGLMWFVPRFSAVSWGPSCDPQGFVRRSGVCVCVQMCVGNGRGVCEEDAQVRCFFHCQSLNLSATVVARLSSSVEGSFLLHSTALLPPSLLFPISLPCMPSHLLAAFLWPAWMVPAPSPCSSNLHGSQLQWLFCVACSPFLPSSPAGPTPSRSFMGRVGGQGYREPLGWRGAGELFPCFLLLLTNLPFLCLD